jgi:hypothetical protein
MKPSVKVYYNKFYAYSTLALFIGVYCFLINGMFKGYSNIDLVQVLVILSIFFLYFIIKIFIPVISKRVAVEITSTCIIDNYNHRTLYWKDLNSMNYLMGNRTGGIVIFNVQNPKNYYSATIVGICRFWFNKIYDGYPIVIQTRYLDIDTLTLFNEISEFYDSKVKEIK